MIAALYVRDDSIYKTMEGVDAWDKERDARNWPGGCPAVVHPPCRAWGQLRQFAKPEPGEKELALLAVEQIRENGGVLEHPAGSTLWKAAGLPHPGKSDGKGFTVVVDQNWFGHRARKRTRLYICGIEPTDLPEYPITFDEPKAVVRPRKNGQGATIISKREREATPPAFARWLVEIARRAGQ